MDHHLDEGETRERYRRHWYEFWVPGSRPPPPPASLADAGMTPLVRASFLSVLTYAWLTPLMTLGWQRALQAPDLWRVGTEDEAAPLSMALDKAWANQVERAKNRSGKRRWSRRPNSEASLAMALNEALGKRFWLAGFYKVIGDVGQLMSPLLTKAIIQFAQKRAGPNPPHLSQGIGLAIGLPLLTILASVCTHQFFWRSMSTGVAARTALIASLYSRGLRFRPGQKQHDLVNHVSTDVSRIDYCAQWFHAIWAAPIQVSICLILLYLQLGPAALAGFSLFVLLIPIQHALMSYQLSMRKGSVTHTDQRASLLRELLGSMRVVKLCAYEEQFEKRLASVREKELRGVRGTLFVKATNQAVASAIPNLAAVLAFVIYASTNHNGLDPAVIFPSVGLFQMLRQPLMFLPRALSSVVDARNALSRLEQVLLGETIDTQVVVEPELKDALEIRGVEFVWYGLDENVGGGGKRGKEKEGKDGLKGNNQESGGTLSEIRTPSFRLTDITFSVPRGSLVGIVGPVGCGKSSLLLGLLGEMPQTSGVVRFGGQTAYCSQMAWIQNATLRENVVFGRPWDEERYWSSIRDASLEVDLGLLPEGDMTEAVFFDSKTVTMPKLNSIMTDR